MKYVLICAVGLAAAGFLIYKVAYAESEAFGAYRIFADHVLYLRYDSAKKLTSSKQVHKFIQKKEATARFFGRMEWEQMNTIYIGPYRKVLSEETSADGNHVTLKVAQEVRRGKMLSPVGPMNFREIHDVVMVKTDRGWRVKKFVEKTEKLSDR